MSLQKEKVIRSVRKKVGLDYANLRWLTDTGARSANREREALLRSLSNKVHYGFAGTKIYTGNLSPGCLICGQGYWSCLFINGLCTSSCFYCPQDRRIMTEREARTADVQFQDPRDYVDFLKLLGFRGVGFTGGSPSSCSISSVRTSRTFARHSGRRSTCGFTRTETWSIKRN